VRTTAVLTAPIAIVLGSAASAQSGDPENGLRLAQRWCAACHVVSPEQRQGSADVPAFAAIGRRPDFNAERLTFFLLEPHPKMPSMSLSRQEASDLAAYIAKAGQRP
jgi:mono/diheme cytochrome c family protein